MTLDEIRAALGKWAPPSAAALQEAVRRAAALTPDLLGLTERARRGVMLLPWQEDFLRYGLHALAAAGEPAAWPALVAVLGLAEWQLERLLGEDYGAVVTGAALSLYDGDAQALYDALEQPCTVPGIRRALFEVLARLVWEGRADRTRLIALLDRFDAENLAPPGDAAWEGWQSAIGLLGLGDRAARVRESWRNGRLPLVREAGQAQFLALLAEAEAGPADPARFLARRIIPLTDAAQCLAEARTRKPLAASGRFQDNDPAIGVRLSDAELDWLDDFLSSDDFVLEAMSLPGLDGFLTSLVIGPEPVSPAEYLPEVWGADFDLPSFEDAEQEAFVTGLVMRHWNTIAIRVERGHPVRPLLLADVLAQDAAEWAQGFMLGMAMRDHAWQKLIRDPQGAALAGVIACLAGDAAEEADDEPAAVPTENLAETVERLPEVVAGMAAFWRARRAKSASRRAGSTGRNNPCPCGSGKVFRQCCGVPGRVLS